jgi:hypothetical protein
LGWQLKQVGISKVNQSDRVGGITQGRYGRRSDEEQNQMTWDSGKIKLEPG